MNILIAILIALVLLCSLLILAACRLAALVEYEEETIYLTGEVIEKIPNLLYQEYSA